MILPIADDSYHLIVDMLVFLFNNSKRVGHCYHSYVDKYLTNHTAIDHCSKAVYVCMYAYIDADSYHIHKMQSCLPS